MTLLLLFFCVTQIQAHFLISSPLPLPGSKIKDPLNASGDDFPCHGASLLSPTFRTILTVGQTYPLEFDLAEGRNTAVHGGGSCQLSLTYETDKSAVRNPTAWKVIRSFIGGCPSDATRNLKYAALCNGSNSPDCVKSFDFQVPKEARSGNATLAWT